MSRHSKWSKVKQFKGAIDAKRSASFTKLAREITVAVREGGTDPVFNFKLRVAMDHARKGSMPRENIERAVQRGAGGGAEGGLENLLYEAYLPGGAALIIECLTDNRNRAANDVKLILSEHGAALAASGAVAYLFERQGVVRIPGGLPAERRDQIEYALIDAGAEEIKNEDGAEIVLCNSRDLKRVAEAAEKSGVSFESAELEWLPKTSVEINEQDGGKLEELLDELEALEDVQRVYTNAA
jgi:YebC/PmpR family DNA-binding regulatory protein